MVRIFSPVLFAGLALFSTFQLYCFGAELDSSWQSANLSMDSAAADFNRYYTLVGSSREYAEMHFLRNSFLSPDGKSRLAPMSVGPYQKTLLEIQFTDDEQKVKRFRFVEQDGDGFKCGKYSEWQTENIEPKVGAYEHYGPSPDHFSSENARFDSETWVTCLLSRDPIKRRSRVKETWDLLHSYPIVGMKANTVFYLLGSGSKSLEPKSSDKILHYQITQRSDHGSPIRFLELRFTNGRVSSFRLRDIAEESEHFSTEI